MSSTTVLLHLAGFVALLLWGIHMVHSGVIRAFGGSLRHFLATGFGNVWKAFFAGLGITAVLQSSTATALMSTSFIAAGFMTLATALAVTLGANVGTTLIVQVLTFDVSAIAPIFILLGLVAFKRGGKTRSRDLGRVSIGVGLVLLALQLIVATIEPVEKTNALRELFALISGDPMLDVAIAALFTWLAYSSVAVVLLVMTLASQHIVTPEAALAMVLGANLGNVIPQYLAAGTNIPAKRLALGNLIIRGTGCLLAIPLLNPVAQAMAALDANPARQLANFHTLFNLALAALFIGLLDPLAKICSRILPSGPVPNGPGNPRYITKSSSPPAPVALTNASREVLRMVDMVEVMLNNFIRALESDDRKLLAELSKMDDALDQLHTAVKLHLTAISRDKLNEPDERRCREVLLFCINLEHVGDILDKSLREIASKKIKYRLKFSPEGRQDIEAMHRSLMNDLQLAARVFLAGDLSSARQLIEQKEHMRGLEKAVLNNHLQRLRERRTESVETSALHIDIARDLKRIAAHIASVAYPILEKSGELLQSRLQDRNDAGEEYIPTRPN